MNTLPPRRRTRRNDSGASLILVLSLIVLVTFATMAFFTRSADNTAVENARAAKIFSEQLSVSGADHALSGFLGEIPGGSRLVTNYWGAISYLPSAPSSMIPGRGLAQSSMAADANFANLVRQSVQGGDALASSHGTAVPSRNGRAVSAARWSAPQLLPSGFYSPYQLPCWIYVNGDGSLSASPGTNAIGRFAYNAYDIGGLLDANAAGHPSGMSASQLSAVSGTVAEADLSVFAGVSQADVDALVAFRNPQSSTPDAYTNYVAGAASEGFLGSVVTNASGGGVTENNAFATRQDLIRYATTRNMAMTNLLPYLTHFTRELARPSLVTNGLSGMMRRFDLSALGSTSMLPAGLSGTLTNLTATSPLSPILQATNPDLFQLLRAAVDYGNAWETQAPAGGFSGVSWPTNTDLKAIALGANILDQFTTNGSPVRITYGTNIVSGKKQLPYVARVFLVYNSYVIANGGSNGNQNKNTNAGSNTNWQNGLAVGNPGTGNNGNSKNRGNSGTASNSFAVMFSVIPQVYTPAGSTSVVTGYLGGGTLSISGVTNIPLPTNVIASVTNVPAGVSPVYSIADNGNPATMGFFSTNIVVADTLTNNSLSVSLSGLSFVVRTSTNGSVYNDFGTNSVSASGAVVSAPLSVSNVVLAPGINSNTLGTAPDGLDGVAILAIDPRTLRGAGSTNAMPSGGDVSSLYTNIVPVTTNYVPSSVADTNWEPSSPRIHGVGELGYVFRESPWRSMDFVSGYSADRNLLDVCSAYATPASGVRAGVVNLNTRQSPVIASLLCGASTAGSGTISPASAIAFASNMVSVTGTVPLTNRAQLVDLVASNVITSSSETSKRGREAAVRVLAEPGQTRTWNVLIDVIAQNGKFPGSMTGASDFIVSGERRVWVSVAIDRPTGQVIDRMSEDVNE